MNNTQNIEIPFVVPVTAASGFTFLKSKETERTFNMTEAKVCTIKRITKAIQAMPDEFLGNTLLEVGTPLLAEHIDTFNYIVASAIQNDEHEPDAKLIKFLEVNLTKSKLLEGFNNAIVLLGIPDFLNTYALIKSTSAIIHKSEPND